MMRSTFPLSPFERHRSAVARWLFLCAGCVFAMVILGGMTRLTDSGLSIVEWAPIKGILPPLSHEHWLALFEQYQTSPQYLKINRGMGLEEFQGIFWLEYIHRLVGRATGLVLLLPLLYFAAKRALPAGLLARLGFIFILGGTQGAIGWYMVQSGLNDVPEVSPYRLALHLGMAMAIFAALVWTWLEVRPNDTHQKAENSNTLRTLAFAFPLFVFVQIILGAFVAGNDAGLTYQTFPLMDGEWIPDGLYPHAPWWRNLAEDVTTVQFHHRMMAYLLTGYAIWLWWQWRAHALLAVVALQMLLGILTLLHLTPWANMASLWPPLLATAHQANAAVLLAVSLALCHRLRASALATRSSASPLLSNMA